MEEMRGTGAQTRGTIEEMAAGTAETTVMMSASAIIAETTELAIIDVTRGTSAVIGAMTSGTIEGTRGEPEMTARTTGIRECARLLQDDRGVAVAPKARQGSSRAEYPAKALTPPMGQRALIPSAAHLLARRSSPLISQEPWPSHQASKLASQMHRRLTALPSRLQQSEQSITQMATFLRTAKAQAPHWKRRHSRKQSRKTSRCRHLNQLLPRRPRRHHRPRSRRHPMMHHPRLLCPSSMTQLP